MAERGVNKVMLIGNLGKAPVIRYMPKGGAVANLSLVTSEHWRDKATGEQKEKTEWHRVVVFGKLAEVASVFLTKGAKVYIEGQLQTRKWQDEVGVEHDTTEVIVKSRGTLQVLSDLRQGARPSDSQASALATRMAQPVAKTPRAPKGNIPMQTAPTGQSPRDISHAVDFDDLPF